MMKHMITSAIIAVSLLAAPVANAACYADYKAKQDGPLRLHYGVIQLDDTDCGRPRFAARAIQARIAVDGWTLLTVLSIFGPEGLAERTDSAGQYFLRY